MSEIKVRQVTYNTITTRPIIMSLVRIYCLSTQVQYDLQYCIGEITIEIILYQYCQR